MFLGAPEFATRVLGALLEAAKQPGSGFQVCAVVTHPGIVKAKRPQSAERIVQQGMEKFAKAQGFPDHRILFSSTGDEEPFLALVEAMAPDLCVVAAFGAALPPRFLAVPPLGTVTVHSSLLPKFRGPAPVLRAVEAGVSETGVSLAFNVAQPDAGPILRQSKVSVSAECGVLDLNQRLMQLGADLLLEELPALLAGRALGRAVPQDESAATQAPRLSADETCVDMRLPALAVHNKARSMYSGGRLGAYLRVCVVRNRTHSTGADAPPRPPVIYQRVALNLKRTRVVSAAEAALLLAAAAKTGARGSSGGRAAKALLFTADSRVLVPCGDAAYLEVLEATFKQATLKEHPVSELAGHLGLAADPALAVVVDFDKLGAHTPPRPTSRPPKRVAEQAADSSPDRRPWRRPEAQPASWAADTQRTSRGAANVRSWL